MVSHMLTCKVSLAAAAQRADGQQASAQTRRRLTAARHSNSQTSDAGRTASLSFQPNVVERGATSSRERYPRTLLVFASFASPNGATRRLLRSFQTKKCMLISGQIRIIFHLVVLDGENSYVHGREGVLEAQIDFTPNDIGNIWLVWDTGSQLWLVSSLASSDNLKINVLSAIAVTSIQLRAQMALR